MNSLPSQIELSGEVLPEDDEEILDAWEPYVGNIGIRVYVALCKLRRQNKPSISTSKLAGMVGASKGRLDAALRELENAGFLSISNED